MPRNYFGKGVIGCIDWGRTRHEMAIGALIGGVSGGVLEFGSPFVSRGLSSVAGKLPKIRGISVAPKVKANPKPSPKFKQPTNPPQYPPSEIPPGWRVREMPPTEQYPTGYWKLEKPNNGSW